MLAGAAAVIALLAVAALTYGRPSQQRPDHLLARAALSRMNSIKAQHCPATMNTLGGLGLRSSTADLNTRLHFTPTSALQCAKANSKVSVCNNGMVVMRPSLAVRAEPEKKEIEVDQLLEDLTNKWDKTENKGQVAVYAGGALVALVTANAVVTTIDGLPFVPYFTEVVGTCYSLWFTYRYLLFEDSRKELVKDIDVLLSKVSGEVTKK
eukprot:CAMPEP_0185254008 /NCGR_PEP_ID=MMETSP1359-20130426/2613_1 /TAXON_ID=552665 /ORGANISM="Bigelowiella longifila, Strain CCMP242" /LENGTH=208 /DNA_ID=CAMNT_0027836555 /DNA_START=288 /DNA_END=914 /DNA_ORIENTATION=+